MSLKLATIVHEPAYYHREYSNDIDSGLIKKSNDVTVKSIEKSNLSQRVAMTALPFLSLYKPLSFPISLAMGGLRTWTCLSQLITTIQSNNTKEIPYQLLQTTIAVIALAGTIFAHPLGMLITTGHDLIIELTHLIQHLQNKEYKLAFESCANILNNSLYLLLFLNGGLELSIASLAMQILIGLYHSQDEFKQGNFIEGFGCLGMAIVRGNQLIGQAHNLQVQREELKKFQELVKIILEYEKNPDGLSTFHYAIKAGNKRAVELMVHFGIDIEQRDKGYTPLHRAVDANQVKIADYLLQNGADIEAVVLPFEGNHLEAGYTPLHKAIVSHQKEMTQFLIQKGANVQATVNRGVAEFRCFDLAEEYFPDFSYLFLTEEIWRAEQLAKQYMLEATLSKTNPINVAFQHFDNKSAEYLLQSRARAMVLNKSTFAFPGYDFPRVAPEPPHQYPIWIMPTYVDMTGNQGPHKGILNRIDVDALRVLMKYDSDKLWHKKSSEWLSQAYHYADLEAIAFLYPQAKMDNLNPGFNNRDQRFLIDPFLSNVSINYANPSQYYVPSSGKTPGSLFENRGDDTDRVRELKEQIRAMISC